MKSQPSKKIKRPFGVNVLLVAIVALAVYGGLDVLRILKGAPSEILPNLEYFISLILYGGILAYLVILAVGLWQMQSWAWFLAMIGGGLTLFYCIWHYVRGGSPYVVMGLVIVMVFFLNLTEVKAAFQAQEQGEVSS